MEVSEGGWTPNYRRSLTSGALCQRFPPSFLHPHKRAVYEHACPGGPQLAGDVEVSRWRQRDPPATVSLEPLKGWLQVVPDVFQYGKGDGPTHWHVNFAHSDLFAFYGGPLLAQDELQVLEHPALGSVREVLLSEGLSTMTTEGGQATPILIRGVERRCVVDTAPNAAAGRPRGLYGNRFAQADVEAVLGATRVIDPPTVSNILAMEAPAYGQGQYQAAQIRQILSTAYTGFAAAVDASGRAAEGVVVNTGYWGCGAYGGNRTLMAALQIVAGRMAALERLVFYTVDQPAREAVDAAVVLLDELLGGEADVEDLLENLATRGFVWGVSDGN